MERSESDVALRRFAHEQVGDYRISTANTFDQGWETCVFAFENNPRKRHSDVVKSYNTMDEALEGHIAIVYAIWEMYNFDARRIDYLRKDAKGKKSNVENVSIPNILK